MPLIESSIRRLPGMGATLTAEFLATPAAKLELRAAKCPPGAMRISGLHLER